ncbi:MAG TPA: SET domain-containing protein-lysine N-methyltransferase [Gemmatimonadales bacterium]|nr:SET domain-containing protein-lysine N-methyltransferase [Gemmatimonadales bacterium]
MPTDTATASALEVRPVPGKGRGVFATRDLAEGEPLDEAHVLLISADDATRLEETPLGQHYFHWDGDEESDRWQGAVALGIVSLVNHSAKANAGVWQDYDRKLLVLEALRPIAAGEEILIDYEIELWFDPVEEPTPGTY